MQTASRPKLSIVIPTHGTRELTLCCLDSLARSAQEGVEVIVVDDASGDGTAEEVAARHPGVIVLRNEPAAGFTRSANRGIERSGGELLFLLNSDTEVEPEGLVRLITLFVEEPGLGVAGAALHYPDGSPQWSGGREPTLAWFFALASGLPELLARLPLYRRAKPLASTGPRRVDWVTGAALAMRREVWETTGPLDEGFRFYAQDLDFCLRARRAGWEIEVRPEVRVLHHHGATIGRAPGARRRQNPALLWSDLLRWAQKHRGGRWAARAATALRWGGALRLAWDRLALPFLPVPERAARQEENRALSAALGSPSLAIREDSV